MAKSIRKALSLILALVLVFSLTSLSAMAEEAEGQEHTDAYLHGDSINAVCKHLHMYTAVDDPVAVDIGPVHEYHSTEIRTCADCGYSYKVETGVIGTESHRYDDRTLVDGQLVKTCSICGHIS